ncbi:MAG: ABC transporter substrate-binding protein [Acidobacteria bacterium]|nr:ABC transporter substrate-binding protein [Acidobacteriota bacterium]
MNIRTAFLICLAAGFLNRGVFLCAQKEPPPSSPETLKLNTQGRFGGTLSYALPGEPATFNPLAARENRSRLVAYLTSATLLELDTRTQRPLPGLAKSWTRSPDGKSVRLKLRQVLFSDGSRFTSKDVVFTFEKIYQEDSRNAFKDSLLIEGKPVQIRVLGPWEVEIIFPKPYAASEYILTTIPILPGERFPDSKRRIEESWNLSTSPDEISGLGPFAIANHEPGKRTLLRRNIHYWKTDRNGRRLPYLDEIRLEYLEDRNAQMVRFQSGQLEIIDQSLRPEDFLTIKSAPGNFRVSNAGPSSNLTLFWFNQSTGTNPETGTGYVPLEKQKWFSNPAFRRAVSHAISRDSIVQNVYFGQARPAWSLVPSSITSWHTNELPRYEFDVRRARELLRKVGFSWRNRGGRERLVDSAGKEVSFDLVTRSDDLMAKTATIIQEDLSKIGMEVRIRQEELRALISRVMNSRQYDAALMNVDIPVDPADHVNLLLSSAPMHMWNPGQARPATPWEQRIDELMNRQRVVLNPGERFRLYKEVQQVLAEQTPVIPLVNRDVVVAHSPRVKNLAVSTIFPFALWNVWELYLECGVPPPK